MENQLVFFMCCWYKGTVQGLKFWAPVLYMIHVQIETTPSHGGTWLLLHAYTGCAWPREIFADSLSEQSGLGKKSKPRTSPTPSHLRKKSPLADLPSAAEQKLFFLFLFLPNPEVRQKAAWLEVPEGTCELQIAHIPLWISKGCS